MSIPSSLKRSWGLVLLLYLLVAGVSYLWLASRWQAAFYWLLALAFFGALNLINLWIRLKENHRASEAEILATFGPGNWLTIWRGLAIAMTGAMLVAERPAGALAWLPVLLYTAADIADYLDGYLARRANHATRLGEYLDVSYDGMGMLLVTLLAVRYGQLPPWYLLLGLARYLFLIGIWLRQKLAWPVYPMHDSLHRRIFAGFQMGFMSVVLWPILPPTQATIAGTMFAIPTALGFLRDWFVTTGNIKPADPRYRNIQRFLHFHTTSWYPTICRLVASLTLAFIMWRATPIWQPDSWVQLFIGWGLPLPGFFATLSLLLGVGAVIAVASGSMARLWALLALFPLGFDSVANGLDWYHSLALIGLLSIMLLGPGWYALWRPEEPYVLHRAGDSA